MPLHAAIADKNTHVVSMRWSTRQSQDAAVDLSGQGGTGPGGAGKKWSTSQVKAIYLPALLQGVNYLSQEHERVLLAARFAL